MTEAQQQMLRDMLYEMDSRAEVIEFMLCCVGSSISIYSPEQFAAFSDVVVDIGGVSLPYFVRSDYPHGQYELRMKVK